MKAGDIVVVNLDPVLDAEKGKTRPCLVLTGSGHPWELVIVAPITVSAKKRSKKIFFDIEPDAKNGLTKKSCVDCFQVRCISESRISKKIGTVQSSVLDSILSRVSKFLGIKDHHLNNLEN